MPPPSTAGSTPRADLKKARQPRKKRKLDTYTESVAGWVDKKRIAVLNTTSIPRTRGPFHCYVSLHDELAEDEQLQIFGEESELEYDDRFMRENKIPCRTLNNYTIFDVSQKQRIVSWELIGEGNRDVRFVGEVEAIITDGDDDDDNLGKDCEQGDEIWGSGGRSVITAEKDKLRMVQRMRSSAIFSWKDEVTHDGRYVFHFLIPLRVTSIYANTQCYSTVKYGFSPNMGGINFKHHPKKWHLSLPQCSDSLIFRQWSLKRCRTTR